MSKQVVQSKNIILNVYMRDVQCDSDSPNPASRKHLQDVDELVPASKQKEHTHSINVDKFIETSKKQKPIPSVTVHNVSSGTPSKVQDEEKSVSKEDKQKEVQDVSKEAAALADHHFSFFFNIPTQTASSEDSKSSEDNPKESIENVIVSSSGSKSHAVNTVVSSSSNKSSGVLEKSNGTSRHGFHVLDTAHQNGREAVSIIMPDVPEPVVSF